MEPGQSFTIDKFNPSISNKLKDLMERDYLKLEDLNSLNLIELINSLNTDTCLMIIDQFADKISNEQEIDSINKCEFFLELINDWKISNNSNKTLRPGPDQMKLKEILDRTGYMQEISTGQRKYMNKENQSVTLPTGCECFIGKLPKDCFEDELIPVFEKIGPIFDLRLLIESSTGYSKGYCFVTYLDTAHAQIAAKSLNNYQIRPGNKIVVNLSVANLKLFIGNIPKIKSREELKQEFSNLVEGISDVIIQSPSELTVNDKIKNRGFCFIKFIDHKLASMAKRKLSSQRFKRIFNREMQVNWADQSAESLPLDEETMSKVKILFVKNISNEITEQDVSNLFEQYGKLERVRKMKDYAFVHFEQRDDALKAMEAQQSKILGKNQLEITLARPTVDKNKKKKQLIRNHVQNDSISSRNIVNFTPNNFKKNNKNFSTKRKNEFNTNNVESNSKKICFNYSTEDQQHIMNNFSTINDSSSNEWYHDNFNTNQWM